MKTFPDRHPIESVEPVYEITEVKARKSGGNQSRFWPFHRTQDSLTPNPLQWLLLLISREDVSKGRIVVPSNLKWPMFVIKIEFVTSNNKLST